MGNMLTTKEAGLMSDLLIAEENLCKKARLYGRTLTDMETAEYVNGIADTHEKNFIALYNLLGGEVNG